MLSCVRAMNTGQGVVCVRAVNTGRCVVCVRAVNISGCKQWSNLCCPCQSEL